MAPNFHVPQLQFARAREIDGASVTLVADFLGREVDGIEYAAELGSFILVEAPQSDLIATISSIRLVEVPTDNGAGTNERRLVTCTLVGYLRDGREFERGIERYPTVGAPAFLLNEEALSGMFAAPESSIVVGDRCQRGGGAELARIDRLFGRHTAILGTSGSGKSWTVASLLQSAMQALPHTRFVFIDLHDEYRSAFPTEFTRLSRKVRHIDAKSMELPYWCLNADELEELFVSREHAASNQSALIRSLIRELRTPAGVRAGIAKEAISVDTPVYFSFDDFTTRLRDRNEERFNNPSTGKLNNGPFHGALNNLLMRLDARRQDPRYSFLFPAGSEDPNADFAALLDTLFGISSGTQMTILDLSGMPSEALSIIVGVLCRLTFEYKYWDKDPNHLPISIILEEAHNYLPNADSARHRICLERAERIAKEGRKYGVSLFVISQRPSELSETVLSQCANFVALRLTNPNDQVYVRRLLPDFLAVAVDMLPYLRTGEAVLAGEAVDIPTRIRIHQPNPPPRSNDIAYRKGWAEGPPTEYSVPDVVSRWRNRVR